MLFVADMRQQNAAVRRMLLEIPAKTEDEPRYLVIGLIDGKHWSAVITYRGGKCPFDISSARTNRRGGTL